MKFEEKVARLRIEKHKGRETLEFLEDVKKMTEGEALEYLLGVVEFAGARIDLSLRPMIPRPETEHWVAQAIALEQERVEKKEGGKAHEEVKPLRVLHLFARSGNVGLAILKNIPESMVDFIEVDSKLESQIVISLEKNKIESGRAKVFIGDSWEGVTGTYNVITAVPPYVPPSMKEEVMKELSAEDPLSFFDKEDGFYYHKQVLSRAKEFLKEDGILYLEFDITQREKIEELAKEHSFTDYCFLQDPYGHDCVMKLKNS